jgi:hypothetical protein
MHNKNQVCTGRQNLNPIALKNSILVLLITAMFSACIEEAGRDNPLDPANGDNNLQLSGQVLTFYHPRKAIPQASILVQPINLVVLSDKEGNYKLNSLKPGDYTLICEAEGYELDSANITIQSSITHTFLLDGLPHFEEISLMAHHRSRWFPREELYFIEMETEVSDPDGIGDIQSVICEIPSIDFIDTLQAEIEGGKFSNMLFDGDLPVSSVHQLIGREIFFRVEDDFGTITTSEAKFLTRIIEQSPQILSPFELQTIDSFPIEFQWERVSVPYPASLKIEIFQINLGVAFKTDEIDNIPIDDRNYLFSGNLGQGDYYWTLNIVDEFGNSSSSREGTFQIN